MFVSREVAALLSAYRSPTMSREMFRSRRSLRLRRLDGILAVSYTHLTLPTNREV